jgi:S1/P1 nuclease
MLRSRLVALGCCLFVLFGSRPALAWNAKGHMVVAFLAYKQLDPPVRARVDALLMLNPDFKHWLTLIPASVPAAERNLAIFMIASTWPDQIKSDPNFHDDGTHNGNVPDGPPSSQNIGFSDKLRHKYWHFVDTPFSTSSLPLPSVVPPNAQERITLFLSVLKSTADDSLKSYDLAWLLHIIGDVHQPLHAATRVTKGDLDGDDGGNGVKICTGQKCAGTTKLHSVWDGLLGSKDDVVAAMATAMALPSADPTLSGMLDESVWIAESFQLAKTVVYAKPVGTGLGPFKLTATYNNRAKGTGRAQAALAGARLAGVLNRDLK